MNIFDAKAALDKVITKSRVHMYKPIQVAEILHHHRTKKPTIDITKLEAYRAPSRAWRDEISRRFVGSHSTSSARFQDNLFESNATPPEVIAKLAEENAAKNGIVEAYIYRQIAQKHSQLSGALAYCSSKTRAQFKLDEFLLSFWSQAGLKRSIDKIYEIVVYSIFSVLTRELNVRVTVSADPTKAALLKEFEDFAKMVIGIDSQNPSVSTVARFFRVGVANAADSGLDMWANYGPAVQIKHLSLDEDLSESIVGSVTADRVIIVCRTGQEQQAIQAIVKQLGWQARVQSIVTESDLVRWYEKALRGTFSSTLGDQVLAALKAEIAAEFPSAERADFDSFMVERGYDKLQDPIWKV